jgi:hypothetical protein
MKDEALRQLYSPEYDALRLRLEVAHSAVEAAAVEARRRERLNQEHPNGAWGRSQWRDRPPDLCRVCGGQFYVGSGRS